MTWDHIIIGAGSAGCALAHELVRSGHNVLILEAGGSDRSLNVKLPAAVFKAIEQNDWGYRSEPDRSRGGVIDQWYRGRVLGGSSSINGTKYVRGAAADYERWFERCGRTGGWSAHEIMSLFKQMETSDQQGSSRGAAGPLHVRTLVRPHPITRAFIQAAASSGHPFNEDYNDGDQEGVGYAQFSQRRGLRWSAADAFLKPLIGRPNLKLLLHAEVERVEVDRGRVVAVVFRHEGKVRREVAHDFILCAGAVNSPKVLMLSGIGDRQQLTDLQIQPVLHLPAVGRHLQDQPLLRLTYRSKAPTHNPTGGWWQKLAIAGEFALHREGPISNLFEAVGFIRSSQAAPAPDVRLAFMALAVAKAADGSTRLAPFPAVTVSLMASYPRSRGCIRLASNDPKAPPIIEHPLLDDAADVETLIGGIQRIREIMRAAPLSGLLDGELTPGADVQGAHLQSFVRANTAVASHAIGTCRMGLGHDTVVGPDLRVHGLDNLWIADASIMPEHISADTNAASMMIGFKLGRQLAVRVNSARASIFR